MPGAWRQLQTGTEPQWRNPENADAAFDQTPLPLEPVTTELLNFQGGAAMVLPWYDAKEDPRAVTGMYASANPHIPRQDTGGKPIVGAYEAAVRTRGPVYQWGHEVSGGLWGDQEMGRIMRFPANVPSRYDPYAGDYVGVGDYRDELAAAIANNGQGVTTENEYTSSLLMYEGGG